mgnify:CR=1 FL=1
MKLSRRQLRRLILEEAEAATSPRPGAKERDEAFKSLSETSKKWQAAADKASKEVAGPEAAMASILSELSVLWKDHHMANTDGATTGRTISSIIDKINDELDRLDDTGPLPGEHMSHAGLLPD